MSTDTATAPPSSAVLPSYLDITLANLRHGGTCACGYRLNPGDRAGWAKSSKQFVCIRCVKQALWTAVDSSR
jgi:hypothetical protein